MKTHRPAASLLVAATLAPLLPGAASALTVARLWNEQNLAAIRIDFPDPPVHARNLFHTSVAMYDAWAAYDSVAVGYVHREAATPPDGTSLADARREAISYAAHRLLVHRYSFAVDPLTSFLAFDQQMINLGYPPSNTTMEGDSPAAVGNRVAATIINYFANDGAREDTGYDDPTYAPVNEPLIIRRPITHDHQDMADPNRWQPLAFDFAITQNGLEAELVQTFIGAHQGETRPFALYREPGEMVYHDPGQPPLLGGVGDAEFKGGSVDVLRFSKALDPDEAPLIDISPGAKGNNPLGTNDGTGYPVNPVTGLPYPVNLVSEADFGRSIAEFWADGPDSETPPGHWNSLANEVVESPGFERRMEGTGPLIDPLEWDVKMYFAINASVHDSAIAAWGCKRYYDWGRPISSIRQMCANGQSSEIAGPSYAVDGIPLEAGFIEVITADTTMPGQHHEHLFGNEGEIAIYCWGGEPDDPETEYTGNAWILGIDWLPYQRDTFVTPAFAGYISGHSTFSRAAAEVLTSMTGSPYFPGGIGSHTVPAGSLDFEYGPSNTVTLQWASYYDAADEAGLSRLYGGIHPAVDDGPGRIVGSLCGMAAWDLAKKYFDGSILNEPIPIMIERQGNGDLLISWSQLHGMFYKLRFSGTIGGGWVDQSPFMRAEFDRGEMLIPLASQGGGQFYQAIRSPGG